MTLASIYNNQHRGIEKPAEQKQEQPKSAQINLVLHMPEVGMLVRHLDLLYSRMMINQQQDSQTVSWFNPGQGGVKQSESVN
jgi:coproporphyrinogen III oxidase